MQRAEQRGSGERRVLRRQMSGAHRGIDPGCDLAGDFAAAGEPRRRDVDIDRFGQNAPGELALRQHMHGNGGDGGGQRRGRPGCGIRRAADRRQFVARDLGDQFGNQLGLGGEIAVDGAGRDIGADRDRARSAPRPCRPRPQRPAPPPEWRCAAPPAASRPDGFADRPWRVSVPGAPLGLRGACQNAHVFNVLSDNWSARFEEVNNYSGRMTRRFCGASRDWPMGFPKH